MADALLVDDLAQAVGLSRSRFSTLFAEEVGPRRRPMSGRCA